MYIYKGGFPGGSVVKNLPANTGDAGDIEPEILKCEVKGLLKYYTKKLVEVMEFQLSYFKS